MPTHDDNVELQRKLYAKLASILAIDTSSLQTAGTFLVLAPAGGVLLDPTLDPARNDQRAILVNALSDIRVRESWIQSTRPGTMSAIYHAILRDHSTPVYSLTADEEKLFKQLDGLLWKGTGGGRRPTDLLQGYRDAEDELVKTLSDVEQYQNANPGQTVPKTLLLRLKRARETFENDAQGITVRGELDKYQELQRKRGSAWFSDLQEQYDASFNVTNNFAETQFYPSYGTWFDKNQSWTRLTVTSHDLDATTHNSATSYSGGISASWGLFSVGGHYSHDEQRSYSQSQTSSLSLSFDVLSVSLRYPWMDFGVFESRAWDWAKSAQYHDLLSDGKYVPDAPNAENELLPFVPVTMLIARNVELSADWGFNMADFLHTHDESGGSVGWGPFSLGGRYMNDDSRSHVIAQGAGNKIAFASPQVIGYFVYEVPKSPNPDPSLPWPKQNGGNGLMNFAMRPTMPILARASVLTRELR
jgi:hypothetical protein